MWTDPNGAMEFVAGSHRSGRRYQPFDFRHTDAVVTDEFEPLPDVDANRDEFRIVTWELEPGDAVVFSALTLHAAAGNDTRDRRRRALSIRYTGDDARFIERKKMIRLLRDPGLRAGDRMDCELFPVAWPRPARDRRLRQAGQLPRGEAPERAAARVRRPQQGDGGRIRRRQLRLRLPTRRARRRRPARACAAGSRG